MPSTASSHTYMQCNSSNWDGQAVRYSYTQWWVSVVVHYGRLKNNFCGDPTHVLISRLFFTVRFSGAQCQRGRNSFSCNTHQGNFGVDAFSLFQRLSEAGERHNRIKLCTPITPSHLLTFRDAGSKVWTVNKNYHRHLCKCCVSFLELIPDHRTAVVPLDSVYLHDASWQSHPEQEKGFSNFRSPFTKSQTRCCTHWKLAGRAMQFAFAKNIFQHGTELNHSQFTQSWGVFFFCLWTSLNGHWDKLLLVADCLFRNTATLYFVTATVISCSATVRRGKKTLCAFCSSLNSIIPHKFANVDWRYLNVQNTDFLIHLAATYYSKPWS